MKVYSDKYKAVVAKLGDMAGMMNVTPVDMYGKRVNLDKNDPTNMKKTAEDIQDFYGLDTPEEEANDVDDDM